MLKSVIQVRLFSLYTYLRVREALEYYKLVLNILCATYYIDFVNYCA